jgi:hypothetical protein
MQERIGELESSVATGRRDVVAAAAERFRLNATLEEERRVAAAIVNNDANARQSKATSEREVSSHILFRVFTFVIFFDFESVFAIFQRSRINMAPTLTLTDSFEIHFIIRSHRCKARLSCCVLAPSARQHCNNVWHSHSRSPTHTSFYYQIASLQSEISVLRLSTIREAALEERVVNAVAELDAMRERCAVAEADAAKQRNVTAESAVQERALKERVIEVGTK